MEYLPLVVCVMTWLVFGRVIMEARFHAGYYVGQGTLRIHFYEPGRTAEAAVIFLLPPCIWAAFAASSLFIGGDYLIFLQRIAFPLAPAMMTLYGLSHLMERLNPAIYAMAVGGYLNVVGVYFLLF